ncbi:MAG TPA: hypothetical protein VFA95_08225 [Gammaproteobacteria bacterium]|nr:hypothetical protein [Gammaproteobacteria bacterium]
MLGKRIAAVAGAVIVGAGAGLAGRAVVLHFRDNGRPAVDWKLRRLAARMNAVLPRQIDADTRLDDVEAGSHRFTYHYTILHYRADQLDSARFRQYVRPLLVERLCASGNLDVFVKDQVVVVYRYSGRNGGAVATIRIRPLDCSAVKPKVD